MKKLISLLIIILSLPSLAGCSTIYSNYREIQQLLVIQTLGMDLADTGGVQVSMAAPAENSGSSPRQMSAQGGTITAAIDRAYRHSYEEEIFFSHVNHLLLGEATAESGIQPFLDYICQSPTLRLDIPLYIVREGSAQDAIMGVGDDTHGISEVMQSVRESFASPSNSKVFTVMDTLSSLERHGSALVCAVQCLPTSESSSGEASSSQGDTPPNGGSGDTGSSESNGSNGDSTSENSGNPSGDSGSEPAGKSIVAVPAGYAVIREGKLCKYIEPEEGVALGLLTGSVPITPLEVRDKNGKAATLEIDNGSADIRPVWGGKGQLKGLDIQVHVNAFVLEAGTSEENSGEYINHLTAQLEAAISQRVSSLLQSSMKLKADFLGLSSLIERQSPENYRLMEQSFSELLPGLEMQITVSGNLSHTNDTKEASM